MDDYYSGLDVTSFHVTADFAVNDIEPGKDLAGLFKEKSRGVRELVLDRPLGELPQGQLTVSVKDRQGNVTRVERIFSVG